EDLKKYTRAIMNDYATSFNREINGKPITVDDIKYFAKIEHQTTTTLSNQGWKVDYITIRSAQTLAPAQDTDFQFVILGAATLANIRLIDNIEFCAKPLN
ncbi:MAG: pantoate--beta-alanine ligase, partial [Methylophilaceae bacterium]|nr:pantoate--beta-alanine ligase [Methylophilaceae bacterium]